MKARPAFRRRRARALPIGFGGDVTRCQRDTLAISSIVTLPRSPKRDVWGRTLGAWHVRYDSSSVVEDARQTGPLDLLDV